MSPTTEQAGRPGRGTAEQAGTAGPRTVEKARTAGPRTVEQARTAGPGDALGGDWRVIVRNDDHNTFDHVARTLARVIPGVTLDQGYGFAERIHNGGLAIVWSGHLEAAEHYWEMLRGAGLTMAPLEQG